MSYCRFGGKYEVYCYSDGDHFQIHMSCGTNKPKAGESYTLDTLEETLEKLLQLKQEGYIFNERAIERLKREIKDGPEA